jgi:hypothetical protein
LPLTQLHITGSTPKPFRPWPCSTPISAIAQTFEPKKSKNMTALAHTTAAAPGMGPLKKQIAGAIQAEIKEAKRIQALTNCSWTDALKAAAGKDHQAEASAQEKE